jgi:hypothetical protein
MRRHERTGSPASQPTVCRPVARGHRPYATQGWAVILREAILTALTKSVKRIRRRGPHEARHKIRRRGRPSHIPPREAACGRGAHAVSIIARRIRRSRLATDGLRLLSGIEGERRQAGGAAAVAGSWRRHRNNLDDGSCYWWVCFHASLVDGQTVRYPSGHSKSSL